MRRFLVLGVEAAPGLLDLVADVRFSLDTTYKRDETALNTDVILCISRCVCKIQSVEAATKCLLVHLSIVNFEVAKY